MRESVQPVRIVFVTTVPESVWAFLGHQVRALASQGFEVHIITSPGIAQLPWQGVGHSIQHEVMMRRTVHPVSDLVAVTRLWRLLRRIQPQIVQTHTPKAGLLGMIAASLARVPIRIYTVNGLPIVTQSFWGRAVLAFTERVASSLATRVLCVSRSVRRFVTGRGFCTRDKCRILGSGGSHGVNTLQFDPESYGSASRTITRNQYGIPEHAVVVGYVGRIVPAKGVAELALAWEMLRDQFPELRLLLCGYCEPDHPLSPSMIRKFRSDPRVHFSADRVTDMPSIYAAVDICVLPSYCEGLPNVALESAAMQVPIVATRVPGCVDAIRHGITGFLVEPRNPKALAEGLQRLVRCPELRVRMGIAARKFVSRRFSEVRISELLLKEYERGLTEADRRDQSKRLSVHTRFGRKSEPAPGSD